MQSQGIFRAFAAKLLSPAIAKRSSGKIGSISQQGVTFAETLVAIAIIGISFGSVLFALVFTQRVAANSRNSSGAAEMINGLAELSLASPFNLDQQNERDQPRGVANVLKLTEVGGEEEADPRITNSIINDTLYEDDRTAFSLMQLNTLDGTQQVEYQLPIYVSADTGVIQSFNDGGTSIEILATVRRTVSSVDNQVSIDNEGGRGDGADIGLRAVTWELEYEYRGETKRLTTNTFRASDN